MPQTIIPQQRTIGNRGKLEAGDVIYPREDNNIQLSDVSVVCVCVCSVRVSCVCVFIKDNQSKSVHDIEGEQGGLYGTLQKDERKETNSI